MQVFEDLSTLQLDPPTALTFGAFDGVHRGHQAVIRRTVEQARCYDLRGVVFSFYPHPKRFLDPQNCPPSLTSRTQKIALIESLGVDVLLLVKLEPWLAQMSPRDFVVEVLHRRLGARRIVVGYDSQFGYRRQGNPQVLRQIAATLDIEVAIVPPQHAGGERVSSTRIREAIAAGNLDRAARMLGRRYAIQGVVVVGRQLGRQLGFPTANLEVQDQMLPSNGVYAAYAWVQGQRYPSVVNIGRRPTFDGLVPQVEAHLLGFEETLYGESLELEFVERLRDERRFPQVETLIAQIKQDISQARSILES